jgi:hypothetical protein
VSGGSPARAGGACAGRLPNSCGGFRLARDGTVTRLPKRWFDARSGGTGRRYGADLRLRWTRDGQFLILRHGRIVWKSLRFRPERLAQRLTNR